MSDPLSATPPARELRLEPESARKPLMTEVLDLERTDEETFRRIPRSMGSRRMFGGELIGQAIVAAGRTAPPDRPVISAQGHFVRAGDSAEPVEYIVDRVRDGGSFTTRHVRAVQQDHTTLVMTVSSQIREQGLVHQIPLTDVPPPETLATPEEFFADDAENLAWIRSLLSRTPVDCRFVDRPPRVDGLRGVPAEPRQLVWVRVTDELPDDDLLHRAALGYLSDMFLLATSVAPHGRTIQDADLQFAALDHSIWFHGVARADSWLLYDQRGLWTGDGRALCRGYFYDRTGTLVATVVQQALIRVRQPSSPAGEPIPVSASGPMPSSTASGR